jgi:hypothetical protein
MKCVCVCVEFGRLCGLVVRVPRYRSRGPGYDSHRYQCFWEVVGPERGPVSIVDTIEELLGRKSSGSGIKNMITAVADSQRWLRDTPLSAKAATNVADNGLSLGRYSSLAD